VIDFKEELTAENTKESLSPQRKHRNKNFFAAFADSFATFAVKKTLKMNLDFCRFTAEM
jgi:hypothetical protein